MGAHELPPELDRWPKDPYQLLGVRHGVDPRDLKRAYTQLIRVYKPEQYPDHFRRLREAYESALRQVEFRARFNAGPSEPTAESPGEVPAESDECNRSAAETERIGWSQRLDEIWQTAVSGLGQSAYRQFVELEQLHPGHPELCVRLYWLLAIEPELDAPREAEDWLAKGLMNIGLSGPLGELYRRRIDCHPQEAVSPRCERLLGAPATPGLLAAFAEQRWRAAAAGGDAGPVVARDLERLRPELEVQAEDVWMHLVVKAMEYLAWSDDSELRKLAIQYRRQVEAAEHLHRRLEHLLDRMEMAFEIATVWRERLNAHNFHDDLAKIIRQSRLEDFARVRPPLEEYLRTAVMMPHKMLDVLSGVAKRSSVAAFAFGELLDHWREASEPPRDTRSAEGLAAIVLKFVGRHGNRNYRRFRDELLYLCVRESLLSEQLIEALEGAEIYGTLAQQIRDDLPLRYVTYAQRLFWA